MSIFIFYDYGRNADGAGSVLCRRRIFHELQLLLGFGSLIDEIKEFVEFRSDDDLGAAVALLTDLGVIVGDRIVLAAAGGREARGIDAELILQTLHHR